jgi:hypothetical protein
VPTPDQITRAYQGAVERLRRDTVSAVESLWYNLPNYRDADIARFKSVAIPVVQGSQSQVASLTAAYQMQVNRERGDNVPMALIPADEIRSPRGVDPDVLYQRAATALYTALSEGKTMTAAVVAGFTRLQSIVSTDLQLVKTKQSQQSLERGGFTFFRRVLTGLENCALCSIASTQRYRVENLMPIHPGCDCSVDRVDAAFDPGQVIDPATLERTHGHVAELEGIADRGGRNPDYRELIVTSENGELGPVIRWRGDKFTGPNDL